jgi:hypothetical protein
MSFPNSARSSFLSQFVARYVHVNVTCAQRGLWGPALNGGPLRDLWAEPTRGNERIRFDRQLLLSLQKPEKNRPFE